MSDAEMIRKRMTFYGWVQGVGFRYRASHAADLYGCTGWVKNNYDGSVSMELQGTEEQINSVIIAIQRGRYVSIESIESVIVPLLPGERSFRIR